MSPDESMIPDAMKPSEINRLPLREKLALACAILARQADARGFAGQATARDLEEQDTFWTQTLGVPMEEIRPENILRVSQQLDVLDGDATPNPANRFHAWIYRARPDIGSIVHTHSPYSSALSMLGEPLKIAHMDAMPLYDDVAWLPDWPGIPTGDGEGRIISEALGDKRAILLANHGLLTACATVEEATFLAVTFEHAARLQLLARSVGEIAEVSPELAKTAHAYTGSEAFATAHFECWARQLHDGPALLPVRPTRPELP